jgi:hypothetical protein
LPLPNTAKIVGYGKTSLEYLRDKNGFVTTNKKAAPLETQKVLKTRYYSTSTWAV